MDRAYPAIDVAWDRLRKHLGVEFDESLLDYANCCTYTDEEFLRLGDRFYHESKAYLYDLTHFHFSPYKIPFFQLITDFAMARSLRRLADFGCGIGLDGQMLINRGSQVDFFDLSSPSTEYLRWRLRHDLGRDVIIHDPYEFIPEKYDLVYAVDVVEHLAEPQIFIQRLFLAADYVCFNVFSHHRGAQTPHDMHYPLDHWTLLPEISKLGTLMQLEISGDTVVTLWRSHNAVSKRYDIFPS